MNKRACIAIANRIDSELMRELGQGIDLGRMLEEALYARDVLLVCDAFLNVSDSQLVLLAKQYRAATAEEAAPEHADSSGFNPSRFFNSLFGGFLSSEQALPASSKARQRGSAGRWRIGRR